MKEEVLTSKDFFFCYDHRLSKFLSEKGVRYILKSVSATSNRTFYLYHINKVLNGAIDDYKIARGGASGR